MSMKIVKTLLWSLMCLTLFVACSEDAAVDSGNNTQQEPETPETPEDPNVTKDSMIKLTKNTVSVGVDGGTAYVEYTILNPHQGEKITATSTEPWVNNFNTASNGVLRFSVEPNTGTDVRECAVMVEYRYAEPVVFTVKQAARVNKGFTFENILVSYFEFYVDIIPEDKTMPYIVMSASPEYIISSGFQTGQDFYNDDVEYFAWWGGFYGRTAAQQMKEVAKYGDTLGQKVGKASPGVTYTLYCYYIDEVSGALISDVYMEPITTAKPAQTKQDFNINYELVDGCMVSADVTVDGYDGDYYFDVLPKKVIDEYLADFVDIKGNHYLNTVEETITYWWNTGVGEQMANGGTANSIIAEYTSLGTNPDGSLRSHYDFELLAGVEYYIFAYAMDTNALCSTIPVYESFTTGYPQPSSNELTISVDKVTARTAKFTFTPTNDDYYVAGWEKASDWAALGNSDAQIMYKLLHNNDYAYLSGEQQASALDLEPETEYVLYAFGTRGGQSTTALFTDRFITKSGGEGSVNISFKEMGYYDSSDLATYSGFEFMAGDYYSGCAIYPLEVIFTDADGNVTEDHGDWFQVIYDWTGRSDVYTDKQYIDNLVWSIDNYGGMQGSHSYTVLPFGGEYELAAVVLDTDGMFSKLYRKWIAPTYDGVGDPDIYVSWWNEYQASLPSDDDEEGGDESGDDETGDETGDEGAEVLSKLFSKKDQSNKTSKMSTTTIKAEQYVPAVDEVVAR